MKISRAVGLICLSICAACAADASPPQPIPVGDLETFSAIAQPVLADQCADPSCHGSADRALEVYASRRHRMDATREFLAEPIDEAELTANARNVAAFMLDTSLDDCLVLTKPLAQSQGGVAHTGGEIFTSRDDRELRALRSWLASLRMPSDGAP